MPNIKLDEPVIVDSSTNEPICWGAYQLPRLRLGDNNKLYYRFHGRRDCIECVGQEDIYTKYFEYTCCNNFLCKYNETTAFLAYSDFTRKENGKQAKTLMVRKITVEY